MTTSPSSAQYSSDHKVSASAIRRFWKEKTAPEPLFPKGLLFALPLFLMFVYGLFIIAPNMEKQTQQSVVAALANSDFHDLKVSTSGQEVFIQGPADANEEAVIRAVSASTVCDTWAGSHTCPTDVRLAARPKSAIASPVKPKPNPAPIVATPPHNFLWRKKTDGLLLIGEVPSQSLHDDIVRKANTLFPSVNNQLTVTSKPMGAHFTWATERAFDMLALIKRGSVTWHNNKLSLVGNAPGEFEDTIRSLFFDPQTAAMQGNFKLKILEEEIKRCDEDFKAVLTHSTINFKTGSAEITSSSKKTLLALAEIARSCPIDLRIEGHTDNIGNEDFNQKLSEARAQSVVAALANLNIGTQHVAALGFGSQNPLASNLTEEGRAENRRIEIKANAQ